MNPIRQYHHVLAGAVRVLLLLVCLAPLVVSPPTLFPFVVGKALFARGLIEVAFAGLAAAGAVRAGAPAAAVVDTGGAAGVAGGVAAGVLDGGESDAEFVVDL